MHINFFSPMLETTEDTKNTSFFTDIAIPIYMKNLFSVCGVNMLSMLAFMVLVSIRFCPPLLFELQAR